MELALIFLLVGAVLGAAGGYMLATHIHSVAAAATMAMTRATTIPSGDVAALNAKVDGLGNTLQTIATVVQTPAVAAVAAAGQLDDSFTDADRASLTHRILVRQHAPRSRNAITRSLRASPGRRSWAGMRPSPCIAP